MNHSPVLELLRRLFFAYSSLIASFSALSHLSFAGLRLLSLNFPPSSFLLNYPFMSASPTHRVSAGERINSADTTGHLQKTLREKGIRLTRQRRVILEVMDNAEQHLDVDQILERAQKMDPAVHLVTVYRTIDLLKKEGLIDELDLLHLRGDRHYYETHGPRDHIHVACLRCGKVREFESRLYEQLKEKIARDFNMKVTVSRTEVGGYCAECLDKSS